MKLIHGDCLVEMAQIPDHSIDMILCDLPYGTTYADFDTVLKNGTSYPKTSIIPLDALWWRNSIRFVSISDTIFTVPFRTTHEFIADPILKRIFTKLNFKKVVCLISFAGYPRFLLLPLLVTVKIKLTIFD